MDQHLDYATWILDSITAFAGLKAYSVVFLTLFICGMGVPIPEDIILISAGILAGVGNISLIGALLVGFFGVLVGDTILFFAGQIWGERVLKLPVFRYFFTPQRIQLAKSKLQQHARVVCFVARFLPGLRAPIYLSAGMLGVKTSTFLLLDGLAALLSVPIWIFAGWYVGRNYEELWALIEQLKVFIISGLFLVLLIYVSLKWLRRSVNRPN